MLAHGFVQLDHFGPAEYESVSECLSLAPLNDVDSVKRSCRRQQIIGFCSLSLQKSVSCLASSQQNTPPCTDTHRHTHKYTHSRSVAIF